MISIPQNSASIVISPPLSGKKEFIYRIIQDTLKSKEPIIFLLTDSSPEDIKKDLMKNRIFYAAAGNKLRFIDCYSQQAGNMLEDTPDTKRVSGPLALNEISIALAQFEAELHKINHIHKIIFDSLSTLLMYSNPKMIGRFLQILIAKIKNAEGSIIFTLEKGMHDKKDIVTIEHLMQAIIHIKKKNNKTLIKAEGIEGLEKWTNLQ